MQEKNFEKRLFLFPLAALFLANPHVSAFDILPDIVGILALMYIFAPLTHISLYMQEVQKGLARASLYTALRIPAMALLVFLFIKYPIQTTLFPLFSLSFFILDCIFILPTLMRLCRALGACDEEYGIFSEGFAPALAALAKYLPFFFILRGALPFFADLLLTTDDGAKDSLVAFYPFAAILALLASLVLAYYFYTAFKGLKAHLLTAAASLREIARPYDELAVREKKLSYIRFGWIFILFYAFCAADFYFGGVDYAPDVLSPVFVLLALLFFKKSGALGKREIKKPFLCALALSVPALCADVAHALFFRAYDWRDIYYSAKAEGLYILVLVIFAVKVIGDILLLCLLYRSLFHMATEETGDYVENSPIRRQEEKNRRSLGRIVLIFCLSGVLGAILEYANMLCSLFPISYAADKSHVAGGSTFLPLFDFLGILVTALMLLRFAYMLFSYWRIMEETRIKYKLDEFEK